MRILLLFMFAFSAALYAEKIDPSLSSYQLQGVKQRVDTFDFSGDYPLLEDIDIDAKRKMRVELTLDGVYPLLNTINYQGTFGTLKGTLAGNFPALDTVNIFCTSAAINLDLQGKWEKDCVMHFTSSGVIDLILPKDIGVIVHTTTSYKGKVSTQGLKKQGKGWLHKTFCNALYGTTPNQLTLHVHSSDGKINLH